MLEGIKKLVNMIKFKFKGTDNLEFEFDGQEIDYLPNDEELEVDLSSEEDFTAVHIVNDIGEVQPIEWCFDIKRIDKKKKTSLLRQLYGKDKGHLIHILVNTRKPRVRKKLVKRIIIKVTNMSYID